MPATLKIKVIKARNLPGMDRSSGSTDAFVEVRFSGGECDTTSLLLFIYLFNYYYYYIIIVYYINSILLILLIL